MFLPLCFIILTVALAIALYLGAANIALKAFPDTAKQKLFIVRTGVFLAAWLFFIAGISLTGIFTVASMPPRIPLLLVLPAFIVMIIFFTGSRNKQLITATPHSWLIYLQSFRRIVELLIWGLFLKGVLPKAATFEGYNFDILIGLTAPLVAYLAFNKRIISSTVVLIWNFAGFITLAIVVFILLSHAYFPAFWHGQSSILGNGIGIFPYTYLAGFFMPLAVFLHIFSIIKIRQGS